MSNRRAGKEKPELQSKKIFSLDNYKKDKHLDEDIKDKPLEYIPLSHAFQESTGLPGIPKGSVTLFRGYSNTGKSTSILESIRGAQKSGVLPVIIDTENSFSWEHAKTMGVEYEEVWDDETGEVINYKGFFIYINNDYLINNFGKLRDKNRDEAVVEDVASFIHHLLDEQKEGKLPYELCFLWDSIGTLDCEKGVVSKATNNMWTAGAIEQAFRSIINHRIPSSKKEGKEYTNTFAAVQKIWLDSMSGAGVVKHKGGEAFFYGARLIVHYGGVQSHGTSRIVATANKRDYAFGIETKIEIIKNQINGISYKGSIISTPHGFILKDGLDEYKKENKDYLLSKLGVDDGDINIKKEKFEGDLS